MSDGGRLIRRLLPFERNYTTIPNEWIRDDRLSFKARGIRDLLLSHKDGWGVTLQQLAADNPLDGIASIRTGVNELEEVGYLIRRKNRRGTPDDWELCDPSGLSDPALFGYSSVRKAPVHKSPSKIARDIHASENRTRHAFENRTPIEDQLRNNSLPSATTVASSSPVDKDASGGSHRPASAVAGTCAHGHPYVGLSGGGVPFCALGCSPIERKASA